MSASPKRNASLTRCLQPAKARSLVWQARPERLDERTRSPFCNLPLEPTGKAERILEGGKHQRGLAMRRFMIALVASLLGFSSAPEPWAQTPPPVVVPQMQPRINEPGPQLSVPPAPAPTPAPVQQAPSTSTASPAVPTSRQRATKQRQVSPDRSAERSGRHTSRNGGYCSYERCIQHCWDTGQQAFVSARKVANSCPDLCKHRGCGDLDRVARGVWPQGW
jgi:hypothetical protein